MEQCFQLAVVEFWNKVDLEDFREALRHSRSHKVFPVQRESRIRAVSMLTISNDDSNETFLTEQQRIKPRFLQMFEIEFYQILSGLSGPKKSVLKE